MSKLTIGEFLATQRRIKGYTQQQVADMLGVSNRTLSSWEQGRTYPDILILPTLAEIYGISVDDITRGTRSGEPYIPQTEKADNSSYIDARNTHAAHSLWIRGISLASPIFAALAAVCVYYSVVWAIVLCVTLGVLTAIATVSAIIYFNRSALYSTGAYTANRDRGGASDKCSLAISLNTCRTLLIAGWAYILPVAVGTLLLWFSYTSKIRITLLISLIVGVGVLAASVIYRNIALKKYGDGRQNTLQRRNRVLFLVCLSAILPVIASGVCVSKIHIRRHEAVVYSAPREEFIRAVQTVNITEPTASLYGVEEGEVFFDIQAAHVGYKEYINEDGYYHIMGNLYCGNIGYFSGLPSYRRGSCLNIYVRTEDGRYEEVLNALCVTDIGEIFEEHYDFEGNLVGQLATIGVSYAIINEEFISNPYKLRDELITVKYGYFKTPFRAQMQDEKYIIREENGNETLKYYVDCDYFPLVMPIACIVSAVSLATGLTVYYIMRRRIY